MFSVRFSPDDSLVAASTFNGNVFVVNTGTGAVEHQLGTGTELPVMCVCWRPAGAQVRRATGAPTSRGAAPESFPPSGDESDQSLAISELLRWALGLIARAVWSSKPSASNTTRTTYTLPRESPYVQNT